MDEQLEVALKGGEFKRLLESFFSDIKKKYDLKKVDIEVLFFLSQCSDEDTPTDIYRRLKLNRGHVSQAIDNLCRRKYITAIPDAEDRRYTHYKVTKESRKIIEEISEARREMDEQLFKGITREELETYKKTTEKIYRNIAEMLKWLAIVKEG